MVIIDEKKLKSKLNLVKYIFLGILIPIVVILLGGLIADGILSNQTYTSSNSNSLVSMNMEDIYMLILSLTMLFGVGIGIGMIKDGIVNKKKFGNAHKYANILNENFKTIEAIAKITGYEEKKVVKEIIALIEEKIYLNAIYDIENKEVKEITTN